jgi:two-component system, OmpR family, phosphate regulon sensor histidine kinase PhoR
VGPEADYSVMPLFARPRPDLPQDPDRWKSGLEAALSVSEIASSATPLADAVDAMLRAAIKLLEAEQGSIMMVTDGGRALEVVAAGGVGDTELPAGTVPVGESVAGRVIATGQPLRLGEIDQDAFVNFVPKQRAISSSVVVPLRVHGRSTGVLSLNKFSGSEPFTDEDVRVAQMFASQAAGLIYRAQLHERAEQRSSDLMALVESSRGLVGTLGVENLLQHMLDGGSRLCGSKNGFACLLDPESGSIERGVFRGLDKQAISAVMNSDAARDAIELADVVIFDLEPYGTLVAVGLRTVQGTRGLVVATTADRRLAEERIDLLRAFAQQCSIATGAAELHGQINLKESQLSSIINGVPNPIVLVDSHKRIVALNAAAETLFGASAVFAAGAAVEGTLGHPQVEGLLTGEGELQSEIIAGNPPQTFKARVVDVRVPGAPIGRVLLMDDVTSEREIMQMQRDFVAMVGHELRTPLTIIKGFAWTLKKRVEVATPGETRDVVSTIVSKADHLERLIEDLLYVSSIEAREATLRIERVDIGALIRTMSQEVVRDYEEREIVLDITRDLHWTCDETKIGLLLRHLLDNALKFSEAPTPVLIQAYREDDCLRIDVRDSGVGVVSSDIPHIFERFRQVDNSTTRAHGGTGVGLYLSAQLVKMHHGRIWVDSTWGKGSTFSIALPASTIGNRVVAIDNSGLERHTA